MPREVNTAASANRTLLSNSAIAIAGTLASALASVAYVSLGARWLGPVEYGSVGATISLANVLFLALSPLETGIALRVATLAGGASSGQVRGFGVQTLRGIALVAAALACVWMASSPIAAQLTGRGTPAALQWLGLFFCASLAACVPRGFLRGREMFGSLSANLIVESVLRLIIGLSLIAAVGGAAAMVAGYALAMMMALAHGSMRMFSGLPTDPSKRAFDWTDALQPLRAVSLPLLGINLYTALMLNADVIAAKHFLDPAQAGLYAGSASVSRLVLMGASPVLSVLFSRIAVLSTRGQDTTLLVGRTTALVLGVLVLSMIVPGLKGGLLLHLILGEAYIDAEQILVWQWATVCVMTAQSFFAHFMLATAVIRAGWMFLVPCALLLAGIFGSHGSGTDIARMTFLVCAGPGSLTYLLLWRLRTGMHGKQHA